MSPAPTALSPGALGEWPSLSEPVVTFRFFKRFYLFIFREGKGGRERERNIDVGSMISASPVPPAGGLARNPSMHPDGNHTGDSGLWGDTHPLSHSGQGCSSFQTGCLGT